MPNFSTAAQVISQAARELSLISADVADPFASADANILQLCSLLTAAGREIVREHRWTQFITEYTFTTIGGTEDYDLPSDFLRMIPQTQWDRTTRFPLGGPLSPQEWQYLNARLANVTFRVLFRPWDRQLHLYGGTSVPDGHTIAFEYMSSYWVNSTSGGHFGGHGPTPADQVLLAADVVYFDVHLITRALKRAFLRQKGYDSTVAEQDYQRALASVMTDDGPNPVLSLNGPKEIEPLIGDANVPITNYGG